MGAYNQTLNMAENLAQQPYQPYTGQMLAGFTPDQQAAFQGVQNMQGYMQPYINAGTNAEQASLAYANPANYNAQSLSQYYNPYQQSVIDTTQNLMNQQNAIQQSQLLGNANLQGGGAGFNDRTGIAQAALAGQQALANNAQLAQLEQQGYQNAQTEYNQQQQQAIGANQAAAYGLGQLGTMGQQGNLQELQALLGTGGQQQQLAQQQLSGAYQQWLNAQAWPYQQTAFLADIAAGIGPAMGGTTNTVGFGQNTGQSSSSNMSGSSSGGGGGISSLLSMLPAMFAKDGGYIEDRDHLATGGASSTGLGSLMSSAATADAGGSSPTNAGFGSIGYTPASYLDPGYQTGLNAIIDPQAASQMAESKWTSAHYTPQQYANGGRAGYAEGGNPGILPNLKEIYGNPLFMGLGSLIDNKTMPYAGTPLPQIHAQPSPKPDPGSMGYIPRSPIHTSGGGGGHGGGGEGGGGGKGQKPAETNPNAPLSDSAAGDTVSADEGASPSIASGPDTPAMAMTAPSMDTPTGDTVGFTPNTNLGVNTIPNIDSTNQLPLLAGGFGGFAEGGRVGKAEGGGLGNLGTYAPSDMSSLDAAAPPADMSDPFGGMAGHTGGKSFTDLANQWINNHVIAADPTPESMGLPSMTKQTQPRQELPSPEMIQTAGMTNLGNGINPGVAALFGGASPMTALMLAGSQPSGAQAGAPFGGASAGDLQAQRNAMLAAPPVVAGYARGNLDYNRMTPEGLFGTTPVDYYTQPLYAKGGRVKKAGGGGLWDRAQSAAQYLVGKGYSPAGAAAIVGNLIQESSVNPVGRPGDQGTAHGIAQWRGPRYADMLRFAGNRSNTLQGQLDFLDHEVRRDYPQLAATLRATRDPRSAAMTFGRVFERPKVVEGVRGTNAMNVARAFGSSPANSINPYDMTPQATAPQMAQTAKRMFGNQPLALQYANLQPTAAPQVNRPGSVLNYINPKDPSGPLLNAPAQSPSVTAALNQPVGDMSRYIAKPVERTRGLSLADLNPVGSAQAAEAVKDQPLPQIDTKNPNMPNQWKQTGPAMDGMSHPNVGPQMSEAAQPAPTPPRRPTDLGSVAPPAPTPPRRPTDLGSVAQDQETDPLSSFFDSLFGPEEPQGQQPQGQGFDLGDIFGPDDGQQPDFDLGSLFDGKAAGGNVRRGYATDGGVDEEDQQDPTAEADLQSDPFAFLGGPDDQQQPTEQGDDLFGDIGSALGELFGVSPAEAAPAKGLGAAAQPTGGAPAVTARDLWGMPSKRSAASDTPDRYSQLMADHRQLTNNVLTAPNKIAMQTAQAALRANEWEMNQLRMSKQFEDTAALRRDLLGQRQTAAQEAAAAKENAKNHPLGEDVDWNAKGDEFLKTLPAGYADDIKAYAEGRKALPKYRGSEELRRAVTAYDPNFSEQRKQIRDDFAKSSPNSAGGQLVGAAASLAHAGKLLEVTNRLNNTNIGWVNSLKRGFLQHAYEDPVAKEWNDTKNALSNEIERYFKGGAPADAAIKRELTALNDASTPHEIQAHLGAMADLLQGKYVAQKHKWKETMGEMPVENDDFQTWSEPAERAIESIGSAYKQYRKETGQPVKEEGQKPVALPTERIAGQTTFTNPNGVTFVWNGQGWDKK